MFGVKVSFFFFFITRGNFSGVLPNRGEITGLCYSLSFSYFRNPMVGLRLNGGYSYENATCHYNLNVVYVKQSGLLIFHITSIVVATFPSFVMPV